MCLSVVGVVVFGACWVKFLVTFPVVSLLEKNVSPNSGFLELSVILDGRCSYVDVDAANVSVLVVDAVDRRYAMLSSMYSMGLFTGSSPASIARRLCPMSCNAMTSARISS